MNSINAALRDQEAAKAEGEAKRILMVAQAEAEKQAKIRQGEVIAGRAGSRRERPAEVDPRDQRRGTWRFRE